MAKYKKSLIGVFLLAMGINLMLKAKISISPFDTLSELYSLIFKLDFGVATFVSYSTFFILSLFFVFTKKLSFKELSYTIAGALLVPFLITTISHLLIFQVNNIFLRIIIYLIGYALYVLGVTHIIRYNVIMTPFDKFQKVTAHSFGTKPGNIRVVIDIIIIIIAAVAKYIFNVNTTFGIITLILMLTTGPIINKLYNKV